MFNTHPPGTKIKTNVGPIKIIDGSPGSGGEGQGYLAILNGKKVFYKAFYRTAVPPRTPDQTLALRMSRTKWLVESGLYSLDERLNSPFGYSKEGGYVCQWIDNLLPLYCDQVDGTSFLGEPRPYAQRIDVLGQLFGLMYLAHSQGIAHGDINSSNVGVVIQGNNVKVVLIDWSNFNNGDPSQPPLMAGSEGSMAVWIRTKGEIPDKKSDVYSLAMFAHELLLGRPVVAGCNSIAEMLQQLEHGDLPGDPLRGGSLKGDDIGLPFEILSPELQSYLRLMLRPNKEIIPDIVGFLRTLHDSAQNLISCPDCNTPIFWHAGRQNCPVCKAPLGAALHIVMGGQQIAINGAMILGRYDLGGDAAISTQHLRIHPMSPGRGHIMVLGRNGIKRQRGKERILASIGQTFDVQAGDRLELGNSVVLTVI